MAIDTSGLSTPGRANLLCVLGMHRSGTSAVTQFLHRLGVTTAPQLLEAMDGVNQEGFWEDQCIVDMNERLLTARGCRWYDCSAALIPRDELAEVQIRAEAIKHVRINYATKTLSVLKDPRLCRLLPFWLDVWSATAVNPIFIHVVRHPFAVAKSLQKRDKIPCEYGIVLWLLHTVEAMLYTHAYPGLVVVYDTFLRRPLELAEALVSRYRVGLLGAADITWPDAANRAVKQDLRHNDNRIDAPLGLRELNTFAVTLYEEIVASSHNGLERSRLELWLTQLQQLLSRYGDEMTMLTKLCTDLMSLSAENVRIGELHSAALAVIAEKDKAIAEVVAEKDKTIAEVVAEKDKTIAEIVAEKDKAIAVIADKDAVIADRNQFISDVLHLKLWRVLPRILRKRKKI